MVDEFNGEGEEGEERTPGRLSPETADALVALMQARGVSQQSLARALGVSRGYVQMLCGAKKRPSVVVAEAICDLLAAPDEFRTLLVAESSPSGRYTYRPLPGPGRIEDLEVMSPEGEEEVRVRTLVGLRRLADAGVLGDLITEIEGRSEFVYLARVRDGLVKIGTSVAPLRRMREFYGDPLAILPGGRGYERLLHERFAAYRVESVGSEVFDPRGELAEFIVQHAGQGLTSW